MSNINLIGTLSILSSDVNEILTKGKGQPDLRISEWKSVFL